jgi:hypothetical protein
MQHAFEQHVGLVVEVINGAFADIADVNETGVVDEAIDRPELRLRLLDRAGEDRVIGDVRRGGAMRMIGELGNGFRVPRDQQKRMTFGRKCSGQRGPIPWVAPVMTISGAAMGTSQVTVADCRVS